MGNWFPKLYDWAMKPLEAMRFRDVRKRLAGHAEGRVLEIGSGTGLNFPFYLHAESVDAIEPNPLMSARARGRLAKATVPIKVHEASAEQLPFEDDTFDTVVTALVFCTIPDPHKALLEIKRVAKNDAKLLFFEHVRMDPPMLAKAQDVLTPFWSKICDGCRLNQDTLTLIRQSGISVTDVEGLYRDLFLTIEGSNSK